MMVKHYPANGSVVISQPLYSSAITGNRSEGDEGIMGNKTADSNTFPLDKFCDRFVWLEMGVQGARQLSRITMKENTNLLLISTVSVLPASISDVYCLTTNIRCFRKYTVCLTQVRSVTEHAASNYISMN